MYVIAYEFKDNINVINSFELMTAIKTKYLESVGSDQQKWVDLLIKVHNDFKL